ncbi:MAG: hypothetical protein Cons2KO_14400 [Congregibacter sp.]
MADSQRLSTPLPTPHPTAINAVLRAVRQAADVLCDRWTMSVLLLAFTGVTRFNDFRAKSGIASRQLTQRLLALESHGIMIRMPYSLRPLRHGTYLTPMGEDLFQVFACMTSWEQIWGGLADELKLEVRHLDCHQSAVSPQLVCSHCKAQIHALDIVGLEEALPRQDRLPSKKTMYRRSSSLRASQSLPSPLPHAIEIVGDKWTIEILVIVFMRIGSFVDIQEASGISSNVLSDRLGRLGELGILRQVTNAETERTGTYKVTQKGVAFYPILLALQSWADKWLPNRLRSPLPLRHKLCGRPLATEVSCDHCELDLTAHNTKAVLVGSAARARNVV